jgi:predicted PurR-regulated permease PerM
LNDRPWLVPRLLRYLMVAAAISLVLWLAWASRGALIPFLLGVIIAYVIYPAVELLARRLPSYETNPSFARGLSVVTVYVAGLGVLTLLGFLFVPVVIDQVRDLIEDAPELVEDAQEQLQDLGDWYEDHVPEDLREQIDTWRDDIAGAAGDLIKSVAERTLGFATSSVSVVLGYLVVPFWVFYLLKDRDQGLRFFYGLFPPRYQEDARNCVMILHRTLGSYIRAQLLLGLIIGIITAIGLRIMGINFAIGLGVIAGFTELVPIIGPILGFIPAIIIVLATEPEKWWVVLFYIGVQQLENQLLVPRIQGHATNLHPAVILVLMVAAGHVAGFIGLVIVVPLAAVLRNLFVYIYYRLKEIEAEREGLPAPVKYEQEIQEVLEDVRSEPLGGPAGAFDMPPPESPAEQRRRVRRRARRVIPAAPATEGSGES